MTASAAAIEADLTWTGGGFARGRRVEIGADGRITAVAFAAAEGREDFGGRALHLPRRALLPGFVSAHSHAFQRGLRGRGERFPNGSGSFWTWREAMYGLVESLDAASFRALCLQAFREMRAAGVTAVGEFHYLHHLHVGAGEDWAFDDLLLDAATEVGIRLVLIEAYYRTGGIGRPLEGGQRRFHTPSPEAYWRRMDRLAARLDPRRQALGAAVHSLRAASLPDLAAIHAEARRRGLPFHLHLEEQRREIEEVAAAYGARPMEVVLRTLGRSDGGLRGTTAVHCTHSDAGDMARYGAAGGGVCLCPLTEASLGDGLADVPAMRRAGATLSLGSDSNARISTLEEMRWLEHGQRLRTESRGVLADERGEVARVALAAATTGGATALGLPAGAIEPGLWADFVAIDLDAPTLAGATPDTLLEALLFGAGDEAIAATCVGGEWQES